MYSYADALRYVLKEQKQELINLEENLNQSKFKELIGYAKFNMWTQVNSYLDGGMLVPEVEIDEVTSDISDNWINKNQELQEIYLRKIEICERHIRWLESNIPYYDKQEMKSKEQRDKEFEEHLKYLGINPKKDKEFEEQGDEVDDRYTKYLSMDLHEALKQIAKDFDLKCVYDKNNFWSSNAFFKNKNGETIDITEVRIISGIRFPRMCRELSDILDDVISLS